MNPHREARRSARHEAADLAYTRLRATETAIETAYTACAEFAADLPRLRAQANLSSVVGQEAFDDVTGAMSQLNTALATIARAHGSLHTLGQQIGVRATGTGMQDKPPATPPPPPSGRLAVVAGGRA